jgi:hypothetical protein
MDYKSIPDHIRKEVESYMAEKDLDHEEKEEARRQITEIYWIAQKNPHPLRLRYLSLRLSAGIWYQKSCLRIKNLLQK